jgi:hypothetical protein
LIIRIILEEEYKLRSSLCSFLQLPVFHPSLVQIFFSTPCSQTTSVNVREQISHPCRTTGKLKLYIF